MKKFLALLPVIVVIVSGCVNISPEDIARATPIVKQFLEEHPNAKLQATHFTASQAESMLEVIKQDCDNPYIEAKEYYRFTIEDNETGFKAVAWIDWENQIVECAYKEGPLGERQYGDKETDPNKCVLKHHRRCYDGHVYWFDSCGNKQEKIQRCEKGCAESQCLEGDCKSHAQSKCYGQHVYWFDSCGHVQEKKEYCEYGCDNGFCKRPAERSCTEAGGYCINKVGCPEDARVCPDGTVVTRVGPNCEFRSCPTTANCAMICEDGSAVECRTVEEKCLCESCPTSNTNTSDSITGMIHDTDATAVTTNTGVVKPISSEPTCNEYYVCPNGEKIKYCELVKSEVEGSCVEYENGTKICSPSGASVGCVCRANPRAECSDTPTSDLTCRDGFKLSDDYWCSEGKICCMKQMTERERVCKSYGGVWKQFRNGCVDSCDLASNPDLACTQAITNGCDCGEEKCWNGEKCVRNPVAGLCEDTDGGKNYHTAGVVETSDSRLEDHCNSDGTLTEKYCTDSGQVAAETVECEEGYECKEGACVEEPNCAKEGEMTSANTANENDIIACCAGLESLNPRPELYDGGMLCYNPEKDTPACLNIGEDTEGWYYPNNDLVKIMECSNLSACQIEIPNNALVIESNYSTGSGSITYRIESGGVLNTGGGSNIIFIENGGRVESAGGSNIVYLKNEGSFNAGGGGSNIVYYQLGANTDLAGASAGLHECETLEFIV